MCARTCLEARVPYLRRAVVDAILAHPRDRLATGTRAKEPLLAAASDILPARIHAWIKTKFSAPGHPAGSQNLLETREPGSRGRRDLVDDHNLRRLEHLRGAAGRGDGQGDPSIF